MAEAPSVIDQINTHQAQTQDVPPIPNNIMMFLAMALGYTQTSQEWMGRANQALTIQMALLQGEQYMKAYEPCTPEDPTATPKRPRADGGIFSYDAMMVAYYTAKYEEAVRKAQQYKPGDSGYDEAQNEQQKAAMAVNGAQLRYQADGNKFKSNMGLGDAVVSKMRLAAQADDQNIKKATDEVKVIISQLNFTSQLISHYKKIKG